MRRKANKEKKPSDEKKKAKKLREKRELLGLGIGMHRTVSLWDNLGGGKGSVFIVVFTGVNFDYYGK